MPVWWLNLTRIGDKFASHEKLGSLEERYLNLIWITLHQLQVSNDPDQKFAHQKIYFSEPPWIIEIGVLAKKSQSYLIIKLIYESLD
jgi:hypothetical protein